MPWNWPVTTVQNLKKVLEHFKDDPDPLKYEAACFLIENIAIP
jgi:hypothetical protein